MSEGDSDDENVIRYGTPLEPFEEDEVPTKRKFQQPPDQYAVDAHGRRRFHGAFTGGFSAGYGNSVGTPEGWTPSTFKSSRSEKAQLSNQRPEDFMDEEDRSEFGIAPQHLQTNQEFSGRKRSRQKGFHDGPIPGEPVLEQFVRAVHETAAVKMLRKMGWREGQGVGERQNRAEKKRNKDQHKVYGCYMPPEMRQESTQSSESSDSEFEYDTLFAPDDYEPYILERKNDRFGLGYKGLSRHSVLGNMVGQYGDSGEKSHLVMKDKGKKVSIRGQAFGVGAFEADDEDIYATEDMSHYDFTLGGPSVKTAPKKTVKASNVLEGFVKAAKSMPSIPSYPPPALPRDFVPVPASTKRSRFEPTTATQRDQGLGRHELSAEARGALLGETQLPKSMLDSPSTSQTNTQTLPKNEELTNLLPKTINFTAEKDNQKEIDFISIKDSGKEVPKVFKPFMNNPQKQARYERFVHDRETFMKERDSNMDRLSEWERNREMVEFEQAEKLYRPLSGAMGERFTHASEPDDALNPLCTVAKSSTNYGLATPEQIEAAKIGAYGVITRRETTWRPEAIVCKRFNVPELGRTGSEPTKEEKQKVSYSIFSYMESSVHDKESFTKEQSKFGGSKSLDIETRKDVRDVKEKQREPQINNTVSKNESTGPIKRMTVAELFIRESEKALENKDQIVETIEKFDKMDLYKSIFLSDSENEDSNEDKNTNMDHNEFIDRPKNVERNTSPPRGIFANIDFDEINSWKRSDNNNPKDIKSDVNNSKDDKNDDVQKKNEEKASIEPQDGVYGPKIPENFYLRLESETEKGNHKAVFRKNDEAIEIDSSSESDSWVDIKEVKSKKQKKKKVKKHKSKHKKSKNKKKDR